MRRIFLIIAGVLAATGALAWEEPARGTQARRAMLDALRPHAAWMLGEPVEFVVYDLRRQGNLGFANVWPQRPGGQQIELSTTPGARRGAFDPTTMDGTAMQALLEKSGSTWVAVLWAVGATDVWWSQRDLCLKWRPVIQEACGGF